MIKGKSYGMLLNHLDHKVVEIKSTDLTALFEVTVLDKDKAYYKFNWTVEKYTAEGPLKGLLVDHNGLSPNASWIFNLS